MKNYNKTIFVLISGGVDSSVAAALLKGRGFNVVGVFIKGWSPKGDCFLAEQEDARRVAEILKIPFYVFDFSQEYKNRVADYMIQGYKSGITPNPDVECNRQIKFGLVAQRAFELGADFVASGHYARLRRKFSISNRQFPMIFEAKDKNKDQSYFLWGIDKKDLNKISFPIGNLTKPQVRKLAKKFGLPNFAKKDSQGVCFMGKVKLEDFLKSRIKSKPGKIMDLSGRILGIHSGAQIFTWGQRHGLNIQNGQGPYFVVDKDIEKNIVYVAKENEIPVIRQIELTDLNLFDKPLKNVEVRIRYRQPKQKARIINFENNKLVLEFKEPTKFVAPGQSGVLYEGEKMLGGGVISQNIKYDLKNPNDVFPRIARKISPIFQK